MDKVLCFDIETKSMVEDWDRPWEAGLASLATWISWEGGVEGQVALHDERGVERVVALIEAADLVVSWNGAKFDVPFLEGLIGASLKIKAHADLMMELHQRCGRRWSLEAVARATLGRGKAGKGVAAPRLYQEGRLADLHTYNLRDVILTRDLYRFTQAHGYLLTCGDDGLKQTIMVDRPGRIHRATRPRYQPASAVQIEYIRALKGQPQWTPTDGYTSTQAADEIGRLKKELDHWRDRV